jgi:hypothetical protein
LEVGWQQSLQAADCWTKAAPFAIAGGLAGIEETDHQALVLDGFRAAEALVRCS